MERSFATDVMSPIAAMARSRAAAALGVAFLVAGGGVAYASGPGRAAGRAPHSAAAAAPAGRTRATRVVIRVAHGPVTARNSQYIDAPPAGPSVGDVRTYYLPLTRPGSSRKIG